VTRHRKLSGELFGLTNQTMLFELSKKDKADWNNQVEKLTVEIKKLETDIEEIKNNKIFENAFEWRFEFPEVLDNEGNFVGFDVVIGNPPYIPLESFSIDMRQFFNKKFVQLERKYETSVAFILEGLSILKEKGVISYIAPVTWQTGENYLKFRKYFFSKFGLIEVINLPFNIFEDAYVDTALYSAIKSPLDTYRLLAFGKKDKIESLKNLEFETFTVGDLDSETYKLNTQKTAQKFLRFKGDRFTSLGEITKSTQGLSGSRFSENANGEQEWQFPFLEKGNVYNYGMRKDKIYITDLSDKKTLAGFYLAEPKMLIRRIISRQNRLIVTYTDEKLVFKKDINPFIPINKDFHAMYLTGILASKLISFIYLNSSAIAVKDDFRQTTLTELRNIPIPKISMEEQRPIVNLVSKVLHMIKVDPNSTTNEQSQIDQLVYQLYDLSEEEIAIVEAAVK
jgi:hypothetical protein